MPMPRSLAVAALRAGRFARLFMLCGRVARR
jgi:hypothetical protein